MAQKDLITMKRRSTREIWCKMLQNSQMAYFGETTLGHIISGTKCDRDKQICL